MSQPEPTRSDTAAVEMPTEATAEGTVAPSSGGAPLPTGPANGGPAGGVSTDSGTGPH
jgi:hypothetical protein